MILHSFSSSHLIYCLSRIETYEQKFRLKYSWICINQSLNSLLIKLINIYYHYFHDWECMKCISAKWGVVILELKEMLLWNHLNFHESIQILVKVFCRPHFPLQVSSWLEQLFEFFNILSQEWERKVFEWYSI